MARAAEERAAAAVGVDHRGEGEQDWDGEVVDVCQCASASASVPVPRCSQAKYQIRGTKSDKVPGNVVLGSRVVAGTLEEKRQGGESEQEAEDGDRESEEVEYQVL